MAKTQKPTTTTAPDETVPTEEVAEDAGEQVEEGTGAVAALKAGTLTIDGGRLNGTLIHRWTVRKDGKKLRAQMKAAGAKDEEIEAAVKANAVRVEATITFENADVAEVLDEYGLPRMAVAANVGLAKGPSAEAIREYVAEGLTLPWDGMDNSAPQWHTPTGRGRGTESATVRVSKRLAKASEAGMEALQAAAQEIKANGTEEEVAAMRTFLSNLLAISE